jgi:hypothetical protein
MRRPLLASAIALGVCASYAAAVPLPFKNCGKPGDIISITMLDASVWPPQGTPAPLQIIAFHDGSGKLDRLLVTLLYGANWVFTTQGSLGMAPSGGFEPLPASMPLTLVGPSLPVPAGPTDIMQTFDPINPGAFPITIHCRANVAQAITSANAVLTLTYNGSPGFPQVNDPLGVYEAKLAVTESSGQGVFCFDLISPRTSFLAASATPVPSLSAAARALLLAGLCVAGLYGLRLRLP